MTTSAASKAVLITGASSGIGKATARRLAGLGHQVLIGARRTERLDSLAEELRAAGGVVAHRELDVTSLDSMRAFAAAGVQEFGRIDVLINNAGVMSLSPIADLRIAEWEQMIDVNLRGVLHGIASVLPQMRRQAAGHIVNVSSVSGHRVDPTAGTGYGLIRGYEDAVIERLNEEHGVLDVSRCSKKPEIGERVRILPNHVCVVSNLHDEVAIMRDGVLVDTRRVEARGKTR